MSPILMTPSARAVLPASNAANSMRAADRACMRGLSRCAGVAGTSGSDFRLDPVFHHLPHARGRRIDGEPDRPPHAGLFFLALDRFEDDLVLVECDAELLDHRPCGRLVGREVLHEQPMVDAAVGIDRRDAMARVDLYPI